MITLHKHASVHVAPVDNLLYPVDKLCEIYHIKNVRFTPFWI
jgi:hypothetical protein